MNPDIPTGKFWTDSKWLIGATIRTYGFLGWMFLDWHLDERLACVANVATGLQVGLDNHPALNGQPSHCLHLVADPFTNRLRTAYPVSDNGWCV